jgi:hypothetical protein
MAQLLCRLILGSPRGAQFLFKFGLGSFCPDCPIDHWLKERGTKEPGQEPESTKVMLDMLLKQLEAQELANSSEKSGDDSESGTKAAVDNEILRLSAREQAVNNSGHSQTNVHKQGAMHGKLFLHLPIYVPSYS